MTPKIIKGAFVALVLAAAQGSPILATKAEAMDCGCCGEKKSSGKEKSGCMAGEKIGKAGMSCMKGVDMGDAGSTSAQQLAGDDAMMSGMDHSKMDMSGTNAAAPDVNADIAFAKAMIPHHEAAVEMAKQLLANGKSEEMKAMANEIIVAQIKEIKTLYSWLAKNTE